MKTKLISFAADEDGAISADWVVLTAAMVIFAAAIGISVKNDTIAAGDQLAANVVALGD